MGQTGHTIGYLQFVPQVDTLGYLHTMELVTTVLYSQCPQFDNTQNLQLVKATHGSCSWLRLLTEPAAG